MLWSITALGEGEGGGLENSFGVQATFDTREPSRGGEHGETLHLTEEPEGEGGGVWGLQFAWGGLVKWMVIVCG